jgi:hypothetical protein
MLFLTFLLILMEIDTWRVVEAQDRRVLREQHLRYFTNGVMGRINPVS